MYKKYKKKSIIIEAIRFTGYNGNECLQFMSEETLAFTDNIHKVAGIEIETLEGNMVASIGDYIIKGIKGEFYPCKPDVFEASYTPVEKESEEQPEAVMVTFYSGDKKVYSWRKWKGWFKDEMPSETHPLYIPRRNYGMVVKAVKLYAKEGE